MPSSFKSSLSCSSPDPRRILIIRPSALGDVCRSVPLLVSLRRRFPEARIDWLVQDSFAAAISNHPALKENSGGVILFPRARFRRWWTPPILKELISWMIDLRLNHYDLVIDAQGLFRSGLFAWSTRAPIRIGYADGQELAWLGVNRRIRAARSLSGSDEQPLHTVDRMLSLLDPVGAEPIKDMRLYTTPQARDFAANRVRRVAPRYVLLAPTSRWQGKRWPVGRYCALAEALLKDSSLPIDGVAIVGAPSERQQVQPLLDLAAQTPRLLSLIGLTSVETLMGVVEQASLVVANDSAVLHMAVGFNRPQVGLFGPTNTRLVGPYQRDADVIQHLRPGDVFDHKHPTRGCEMMARISLEEVLHACQSRLRNNATGPA